jgi:DNA repair exonuclease SbcCD ATPase subunit
MASKDYLTEDKINPPDQLFVCVSFFSKHYVKQSVDNLNDYVDELKKGEKEEYSTEDDVLAFKFRGAYRTYEEAAKHAEQLRDLDPSHHVYVMEGSKWCAFKVKDDNSFIEQTEHANTELNDMMKKYEENQLKAKLYHEFRKNQMIKESLEENLENRMKSIEETNAELVNVTDKTERRKLKDKKTTLEEQIQKLEDRKKEIEEQSKELELKLKLGQPDFGNN